MTTPTVTEDDVVLLEELAQLVTAGLIVVDQIDEHAAPRFRLTTRGRAAAQQIADDDEQAAHR